MAPPALISSRRAFHSQTDVPAASRASDLSCISEGVPPYTGSTVRKAYCVTVKPMISKMRTRPPAKPDTAISLVRRPVNTTPAAKTQTLNKTHVGTSDNARS